jgi:hypothetical protein
VVVDRDALALIEVDAPDTTGSRELLQVDARRRTVERFRQKPVYLDRFFRIRCG